jgi:hypothetical protein
MKIVFGADEIRAALAEKYGIPDTSIDVPVDIAITAEVDTMPGSGAPKPRRAYRPRGPRVSNVQEAQPVTGAAQIPATRYTRGRKRAEKTQDQPSPTIS